MPARSDTRLILIGTKNPGANFQIMMDGKSLSYRDAMETALEVGIFLKERHPQSEIVVCDNCKCSASIFRFTCPGFGPAFDSCLAFGIYDL